MNLVEEKFEFYSESQLKPIRVSKGKELHMFVKDCCTVSRHLGKWGEVKLERHIWNLLS